MNEKRIGCKRGVQRTDEREKTKRARCGNDDDGDGWWSSYEPTGSGGGGAGLLGQKWVSIFTAFGGKMTFGYTMDLVRAMRLVELLFVSFKRSSRCNPDVVAASLATVKKCGPQPRPLPRPIRHRGNGKSRRGALGQIALNLGRGRNCPTRVRNHLPPAFRPKLS